MKKILFILLFIGCGLFIKGQDYLYIDTLNVSPMILKTWQWAGYTHYTVHQNGYSANYKTQTWIKTGDNKYYKLGTREEPRFYPKEIYTTTYNMLISTPVKNANKQDLINSLNNP